MSQRNGLLDLERVKLRGEGELGITDGRLFLPGPTLIEPSLNVSGGEAAFRARRVLMASAAVWKLTSASGAPNNSSQSHFTARTRPCWLHRVVMDRQRHAIEQASRRWRGERAVKC